MLCCFYTCSVLQMCHQQLAADVTDKHSALSIDSDCARLTNISDNVTMQSDPTRIKKGYDANYIHCTAMMTIHYL